MICETCADKGIVKLPWIDADDDFALCLCPAGHAWRRSENNGKVTNPLWQVWCAQHQIAPSRIYLLEEVFTVDELRARGFGSETSPQDREAKLRAAGKKGHRR